jgi:MFS family permease
LKTVAAVKGHSLPFVLFLVLTAALCGALVMVIEVLGSRVIGPFFGVSLFVWTSLITVTLVALALGYALGGVISDRKGSPDYLYGIILAAGFFVLAIPPVKGMVLKACLPLGLRAGSLVSSLVLFGPSLFLLGCVSPYIVKIAAREMENIGRTVGLFYAVSTLGSFLGTVLTGFVLIAYFGVDDIFNFVGLLLAGLSIAYFAVARKKWALLALLAVGPFLFCDGELPARSLPDGRRAVTVFDRDTFYGRLKVVDYLSETRRSRELLIDGQMQGAVDLANGLSLFGFNYPLQFVPYAMNPAGKDCLVIGLGAGMIPRWYGKMGIGTDVVEINAEVVDVAGKYFGFKPPREVFVEDARYHLTHSEKMYDYIILDVFNGDTTPGHLLSVEAFRLLRSRLSERGILALNIFGTLSTETFMTASVIRTLEEVFTSVDVTPLFSGETDPAIGNLAVVAYDYPFPPYRKSSVPLRFVHPDLYTVVTGHLGSRFRFPEGTPAIVLTDEYNPIDFYDVWLKETARRDVLRHTDADILL